MGLGWYRERADRGASPPYLEHLGGGAGFWSAMRVYPEERLGMVVMGNATSDDHGRLLSAARGQRLISSAPAEGAGTCAPG